MWPAAILLWVAAFVLPFATLLIHNDHFDRISRARQVARYGHLPFRDFFDPGYFMTVLSSAGLQRLLGDRLLGELLLDATFVATGTVVVLVLTRQITGSLLVALAASLLALLTLPRLYDFDKVLFYPLGVMLCWWYIERTTTNRLVLLAAGLVAGALFRYDTGLYIGAAACVAVTVAHWREWSTAAQRLAQLAAAVAGVALPFLVFVQFNGGLPNAADQIVTYARRERARTRLSMAPRFSFDDPTSRPVRIRWTAQVDDAGRRDLAERYKLRDETIHGEAADRTWAYRLDDSSADNVGRLIADSSVDDTDGLDRSGSLLLPRTVSEPAQGTAGLWARLRRIGNDANAAAFLYYLLFTLPALGALALVGDRGENPRQQYARILSLAVMCLAVDVFILRDPISARIGGIAGPAAVMAAWVATHAWRSRRVVARAAVALAVVLTVWAIDVTADWRGHLQSDRASLAGLRESFRAAARPTRYTTPSGPLRDLVRYVRECTKPDDLVYASWFVPELYFYAQRGFAAGMVVTFGGHWSEPRYEQRIVDTFASQSVPIVILLTASYTQFQSFYPAFDRYLQEHYRVAGETAFGNPDARPAYRVLTRIDRTATSIHPAYSMPCFN